MSKHHHHWPSKSTIILVVVAVFILRLFVSHGGEDEHDNPKPPRETPLGYALWVLILIGIIAMGLIYYKP